MTKNIKIKNNLLLLISAKSGKLNNKMASNKIKFFILTGEPGIGKTTMTKKIVDLMKENGVKSYGFYTEEVRINRTREGFDIVTVDGHRGRLARDLSAVGPMKHKVGKYGVLVKEFETVSLPSLVKPQDPTPHLLVIDEIGKMEFFSEAFKTKIKEIFSPTSACVVLATIPLRKGDLLIESIRNNSQGKVWTLTRENRNYILEGIVEELKGTFSVS